MGTRWSKGSELGVVAMTLGLAFACGGKYDVGSGETGGAAGSAGSAGDAGSGGSSVSGQGGADQGGGTSSGGQTGGVSGDTSGGTAGDSSGGFAGASGASGSSTGGSAGTQMGCDALPEQVPDYVIASPDVVWDRLARFLYGAASAPLDSLPETTTVAWVQERVVAMLESQYAEDGRAPAGLEDFFRDWALEGDEGESVGFWASTFVRGNFADFFADVNGRVSFMSDRDFLLVHHDSTRRGMWMMENLFFYDIGLPPEPGNIEPVPAAPGKTRRQTVEETVSGDTCVGCHMFFDPLGFSLEHYDALGDYRTTENGVPIDASGAYAVLSEPIEFSSIDDLAAQLPALCEVESTFAQRLLVYALDKAHEAAPPPFDPAELRNVVRAFRASDLRLARLLMSIASTPAFLRE